MIETLTKGETMSYMTQTATTLEIPSAKTKTTAYFSPMLGEIEIINGPKEGTFCIAQANRSHYEAGEAVRAIIILDPLAWLFQSESAHEFEREQIAFGMVRRKS